MSEVIDFYLSPIVRIKAKHYKMCPDGSVQVESRKFGMRTQNTSFELLRILLAKAFNISGEFSICHRNKKNEFLPLTSEWDLDVAISESMNSFMYLMIQLQPTEQALEEWDIIGPSDIPPLDVYEKLSSRRRTSSLLDSIISHMETTIVKISRALSFECAPEEGCAKLPMMQSEFENMTDSEGRLIRSHAFHLAVYEGGVEHSLRPVVWKHLLNVFPAGLTAAEKERYLSEKAEEYYKLRRSWQRLINEGEAAEKLKYVTNLVLKDVRRTDRTEKFYSGSDDNKNVQSLFNILTTYAVTHPKTSYCQGMSDLLSPILYVMQDEAEAYITFCGLLKRMEVNFLANGYSIRTKFNHLKRILFFYDRELFLFLKDQCATSLLFTYRWLVLDLKREFPYKDTLYMLEVLWGSIPPKPPEKDLQLYDKLFTFEGNKIFNSDTSLSHENLVWMHNYYSSSPLLKNTDKPLSRKMATRLRRQSKLLEFSGTENFTDLDEAIKLPVHYRKRKYRSYTARKLNMLSDSVSSKETEAFSRRTHKHTKPLDICQSWACGEDFEKHPVKINTALLTAKEFLRTQWCYSNTINEIQLNNWLDRNWWGSNGVGPENSNPKPPTSQRQRHGSSDSNYSTNSELLLSDFESPEKTEIKNINSDRSLPSRSEGYQSEIALSSKESSEAETTDGELEDDDDFYTARLAESIVGKKAEEASTYFERKKELLPPPHALGDGNPFLLFMCVSMIIQHRDEILGRQMDENDLCIYFDKMVRKHKISRVLKKARTLFTDYLNMGWNEDITDSEEEIGA